MKTLYLKIAFRYLIKNKLFSFINIFGLAIGIASFILIALYVNYEKSYDTFDGSESVFRVYMDYLEGGKFVDGDANAYIVSGPTLKDKFPEVLDFVRLRQMNGVLLFHNNTIFDQNKGSLADPSYFKVFNTQLDKGNVNTALNEPYTIVLRHSLAKKIFGKDEPLGKTLKIGGINSPNFKVTGILEDTPRNSHIKNDFLISFQSFYTWKIFEGDWEYTWNQNMYFTYLQLDPLADVDLLKKKVMDFKVAALPFERHNMEPLEDIHLYSNKPYEAETNGSASRIKFLFAIGLIIIIISWLNYINLSTTKSLERAKETGIRKVVGAQKPQLVFQALLESLLLNLVAITIAIVFVIIILPIYKNFIGKELIYDFLDSTQLMAILGFILLGSILSGIYPAFVFSNYTPVTALKSKIRASSTGLNIRKVLIIGQFFATIVLLIGTIMVTKQIKFLEQQPIGANLEKIVALQGQVINTPSDSLFKQELIAFQNEIKKFPFVKSMATARTFPGGSYEDLNSSAGITFPDGTRDDKRITYNYGVSPDYFKLMDFDFVAGRPFRENSKGYSNEIVMNEKFIRFMGISNMEDAIDKTVKFFGQDHTIVGVIKDYHHFGLKIGIEPMILRYVTNTNNLLIKFDTSKLTTSNLNSTLVQIENMWKGFFPQSTFNYTFLDQNFDAQYKEDRAFGSAFQVFTILAILIASMGLFGLTSYTIIQRKKEIGIRKVNGATIDQVLRLLNKDYVKWVSFAFILAIPVSWYAMNRWLEGFAYKTTLNWWVFALAGISTLAIALLTVSWQSFNAATANPAEVLRDE